MTYDYFEPSFSYVSSSPSTVLVLSAAISVLAGIAWYGLEKITESKSRYRAVPLCLLLPFLTFVGFAILSGMHFNEQQIVYRSFDFADLTLALGIGVVVGGFRAGSRGRLHVTLAIIVALLVSMPFAYATNELTGVRHDTQRYEVDAFAWLSSSAGSSSIVQSDERLSYIGNALDDFNKTPWLPARLMSQERFGTGGYFVMEDEWMSTGVSIFPNGHHILDASWVSEVLAHSDSLYVGGPSDNRITIFTASDTGWEVPFLHS